jgi:tetratricopeptide (TPR) repeat protein
LPPELSELSSPVADRYVIERELGRGGMATVWLARDLKHDRRVALKVLLPELSATLGPDRFEHEIRITALLDHPHIVSVLDSGRDADRLWYVMPFVEGESLRDRLNHEVQLPVTEAVRIAVQVGQALEYAHRHGIVHRDVKPENILLSDGLARVADFGVARAIEHAGGLRLTATGLIVGTPMYMSPEQASGSQVDGRSDQYSLASVLYEMLAGEPPYTGATAQAITFKRMSDPVPSVRRLRDTVPRPLDAALTRALAKAPADRYETMTGFLAALNDSLDAPWDAAPGIPANPRLRRVRRLTALTVLAAAAAVGGFALLSSAPGGDALAANVVAVAPFDVHDPELAIWHEGLVDVLARNLDGAGPLRTVAPTTVIRRWEGRADPVSARALGQRTGARLALYGSVRRSGSDSVRLAATMFDVAADRAIAELEVRDAATRIDAAADSLSLRLLREVGRQRGFEVLRLASVGTSSLPALKAFLQGEQWLRAAEWDSAAGAFERATQIDSAFALAFHRLGEMYGWMRYGGDSLAVAATEHAAALNRGLAPRDSLILAMDSLATILGSAEPEWGLLQRGLTLSRGAIRRYPDDARIWYAHGEMLAHVASLIPATGVTLQQVRQAFDRTIELDSAFAPAYVHPIELQLKLGGDPGPYFEAWKRLEATGRANNEIELMRRLLDPTLTRSRETETLLAQASPRTLLGLVLALVPAGDSSDAGIRVARALLAAPPGDAQWFDSTARRSFLAVALAYRGRFTEAAKYWDPAQSFGPALIAEYALLADSAPSSVGDTLRRFMRDGYLGWARYGLPLWLRRGDTLDLHAYQRAADSVVTATSDSAQRRLVQFAAAAASAYLMLARGDSMSALQQFARLPDSLCPLCIHDRVLRAQAILARGDTLPAELSWQHQTWPPLPTEVFWAYALARTADRHGDSASARQGYQRVVDVWWRGDENVQNYVRDARAALNALTGRGPEVHNP